MSLIMLMFRSKRRNSSVNILTRKTKMNAFMKNFAVKYVQEIQIVIQAQIMKHFQALQ